MAAGAWAICDSPMDPTSLPEGVQQTQLAGHANCPTPHWEQADVQGSAKHDTRCKLRVWTLANLRMQTADMKEKPLLAFLPAIAQLQYTTPSCFGLVEELIVGLQLGGKARVEDRDLILPMAGDTQRYTLHHALGDTVFRVPGHLVLGCAPPVRHVLAQGSKFHVGMPWIGPVASPPAKSQPTLPESLVESLSASISQFLPDCADSTSPAAPTDHPHPARLHPRRRDFQLHARARTAAGCHLHHPAYGAPVLF
ncbi:hypothetical protein C8R44DRAFT_753191 [Mycena epipterygia]|nr:hypothetical protein C8R44DRAFT_753191 [Mycena epipterygia]